MQGGGCLRHSSLKGSVLQDFLKYLLLILAVQPEVVKDKLYLDLVVLFFQSLLHSVDTQSNEDKNTFHIFLQKSNSAANESLQSILRGSLLSLPLFKDCSLGGSVSFCQLV